MNAMARSTMTNRLLLVVFALTAAAVDGASYVRSIQQETKEFSFDLDPFSIRYETFLRGGDCGIDAEQLERVTQSHIISFFEGDRQFLGLSLSPEFEGGTSDDEFACQHGTTIRFTGSVTFTAPLQNESEVADSFLEYLYRSRISYASFLRELGWQDLDEVFILNRSRDVFEPDRDVKSKPDNEAQSIGSKEDDIFLIVVIAALCFMLVVLVLTIITCRRRGCSGGESLSREEEKEPELKQENAIRRLIMRDQINTMLQGGTIDGNGTSSSSGVDSDATIASPGQEEKSTSKHVLASNATVGTDMSSVSLSRVLGSGSSTQTALTRLPGSGSSIQSETRSQSASTTSRKSTSSTVPEEKEESTAGSTTNSEMVFNGSSVTSPTSNAFDTERVTVESTFSDIPEMVENRSRGLSPMSDCRGLLKKKSIYRHAESKISAASHGSFDFDLRDFQARSKKPNATTPGHMTSRKNTKQRLPRPPPLLSVSDGNMIQEVATKLTKSALDMFADNDPLQEETSYLPSFVRNVSAVLSFDSVADKPKAPSTKEAKQQPPPPPSGSPILRRRYSFSKKKGLVKQDMDPIDNNNNQVAEDMNLAFPTITRTMGSFSSSHHHRAPFGESDNDDLQLDEHADIDPVFSTSQHYSPTSNNDEEEEEDAGSTITTDEDAATYEGRHEESSLAILDDGGSSIATNKTRNTYSLSV